MTCLHHRSEVFDSRHPTGESGVRYFTGFPFKSHTRRRRKCLECGERFTTYEITVEHLTELAQKRIDVHRQATAMIRDLQAVLEQLNMAGESDE